MKNLKRNEASVYYCKYLGKTSILNDDGYDTGEKKTLYSSPVKFGCSKAPATGQAQLHMFGVLEQYDRVLISDELNHQIDKNTVFFIDKAPEFSDGKPLFDYRVKRISPSLNYLALVVTKV